MEEAATKPEDKVAKVFTTLVFVLSQQGGSSVLRLEVEAIRQLLMYCKAVQAESKSRKRRQLESRDSRDTLLAQLHQLRQFTNQLSTAVIHKSAVDSCDSAAKYKKLLDHIDDQLLALILGSDE